MKGKMENGTKQLRVRRTNHIVGTDLTTHEPSSACSAGVLACEFWRRPAASPQIKLCASHYVLTTCVKCQPIPAYAGVGDDPISARPFGTSLQLLWKCSKIPVRPLELPK